jgi:hypothetical protein
MTEEDQIIAMLKRCNITFRLAVEDELTTIEVSGGQDGAVHSFSHCYVKYLFDKQGKLAKLEFGY